MPDSQYSHFGDRLILSTRRLGHPLCVGLDPHLTRIPRTFRRGDMRPANPETASAVLDFSCAVIDRLEGRVAAVKPQIALFEQLGWRGLRALEDVCERARERSLLVLLDAKRGDIGSTAEGYASAYLEPDSPLPVDAMTLSPYLGVDTLKPFELRAETYGCGLFVLVKTSNPGSCDIQDQMIGGEMLYQRVAASLAPMAERLVGPATGWSSLGAVVGATYPEQAEAVRQRLPRSPFLVPGYGAQGAAAADAVRGFVKGPHGLEGGVVNSSRAILFPDSAESGGAAAWEKGFGTGLSRAIEELGSAVARG